jgi:hypothetical protein
MFIRTDLGYWNLNLVAQYQIDRSGTYTLQFAVEGGKVKIAPSHPQYRQIDGFLRGLVLPDDAPTA